MNLSDIVKLDIKAGDILLVKEVDLAKELVATGLLPKDTWVIFAPSGVQKVSAVDLIKIPQIKLLIKKVREDERNKVFAELDAEYEKSRKK